MILFGQIAVFLLTWYLGLCSTHAFKFCSARTESSSLTYETPSARSAGRE